MGRLTGKQKRFLRGLGQKLPTLMVVGKAGVTPGTVQAAGELLSRRELVKIRLPACPSGGRKAMAEGLAQALRASCVGVVGRVALLYRPDRSLPKDKRITLPAP